MIDFKYSELFSNYKKKKIDQLNELEKLNFPIFHTLEINCANITPETQTILLNELAINGITETSRVIYYFTVINNNSNHNTILDVVEELKINSNRTSKKFIALPKINELKDKEWNGVLYVGKTNSKFLNRFKQHLGNESKKTYALHLNTWAKELTVVLNYGIVELEQDKIGLLEEMENILHSHLNPILGRAGH